MKRKIFVISIIILVVLLAMTLFACNKDKQESLLSVYVNRTSVGEFTKAELLNNLPGGYKFCYGYNGDSSVHKSTEYGYIEAIDCFVVTKDAVSSDYARLNLIRRGGEDVYFKDVDFEIVQLQVYYGNIFILTSDSKILVYDFEGEKWLYGYDRPLYIADKLTQSITTFCCPVSKNYFITTASTATYNLHFGTALSSVSSSKFFVFAANGNMVGRIEVSTSKISDVEGYDGYAIVNNFTSGQTKGTRIISLNSYTEKSDSVIEPVASGIFSYDTSSSTTGNGIEATYFGNGNFLVHIEESGTEDVYFYKDEDDKYWKVSRYLFNAKTGVRKTYKSDVMFLSIENDYYKYSSEKTFDCSKFLNSGYSYVGFGMVRNADKTVTYDRFIIKNSVSYEDGWEFQIVLSLSKTAEYLYDGSEKVTADTINSISVNELVRTYVDKIGVVQISTGVVDIYDEYGNLIGRNSEYDYQSATYNSGVILCTIIDDKNSTSSSTSFLYGALDKKGNIVVPFEYSKLTMFTGYYAIGEKTDENGVSGYYLVGQNGYSVLLGNKNEITDGYNFHIKQSGTAIYRTGAYVYFEYDEEGNKIYGVKSTNISNSKNVLLEAKYSEITLFAPSGEFGVVYAIVKTGDSGNYEIYRLK